MEIPTEMLDQLDKTVREELKRAEAEQKRYSILVCIRPKSTRARDHVLTSFQDLFRYPQSRLKSLILMLGWVVCASVYYALLLDQSELGDNQFTSFFMAIAVQVLETIALLSIEGVRPIFLRFLATCS